MRMMVPGQAGSVLNGRILDTLGGDVEALFNTFFGEGGTSEDRVYRPAMDVDETRDHYRLHFDLPGVGEDQLSIEFDEDTLVVSGDRRRGDDEDGSEAGRRERVFGSIKRSVRFPEPVDAESISAEYVDGVLSVTVPKAAKPEARKIEIRRGTVDAE